MELRLYTFVNFYLSSIQQGIQTAHVQQELVNKYSPNFGGHAIYIGAELATLFDWAKNNKTIITLNGGAAGDIKDKFNFLNDNIKEMNACARIALPFACFHEDKYSLDETMTAVGIVLPDFIYDAKFNGSLWEFIGANGQYHGYEPGSAGGGVIAEFLSILKSCPLAR